MVKRLGVLISAGCLLLVSGVAVAMSCAGNDFEGATLELVSVTIDGDLLDDVSDWEAEAWLRASWEGVQLSVGDESSDYESAE